MNESVEQHADFPSEETLAAMIDGRVDGETREKVLAHLAECEACYGWWEAATATVLAEENVVPMRRPRKVWPAVAAAVAVAAGVAVVFMQPIRDAVDPDWRIEKLAAASASLEEWPIDAQLSGSFPQKPLERNMRGPGDEETGFEDLALQIAKNDLQKEVRANPKPQNLHALGMACLLLKQPENAMRELERALTESTGEKNVRVAWTKTTDPNLLSDLAIAYVGVANRKPEAADKPPPAEREYARIVIDRAIALAPQSRNVAYNRAWVLESAGDTNNAITAWRHYLQLDSTSQWAKEAQKHLDNLES